MTEQVVLQDFVVILAAAVGVVALLRRLHVPSIAGFIVAGAVVGPHALGLVHDLEQVEMLAELGVVLLLFGIGLELSLARVRRLWRPILLGGGAQVVTTVAVVLGISLQFGLDMRAGLLLGFIMAVSSTAIVLASLATRGELETPHGRLAIGILIFQDLCVVPMVLVIPFLGDTAAEGTSVLVPLLTAAAVILGVLLAARLLVPRFLDAIARTRQRDLFILSVFLVCLGTAWAVSSAGVSLALGAFLGGLVVSGSRYRQQAISDLVPLRDVLASVFFVSIGMLLDLRNVLDHLVPILGLFLAIIAGKFVIILGTSLAMRIPQRVSILTAASLSQVGEFSFVLLLAAAGTGLLQEPLRGNLTLAIILSMLATPLVLSLGPHLAGRLGKLGPQARLLGGRKPDSLQGTEPLSDHIIIAGYGLTGRNLARSLAETDTRYVIVDLNTENVRDAARHGWPSCFGDVTNAEVLNYLRVVDARELVISINDADATARATRVARLAAPGLRITVRTAFEADVKRLERAGATDVFAAEVAVATVITDRVLRNLDSNAEPQSEQAADDTAESPSKDAP